MSRKDADQGAVVERKKVMDFTLRLGIYNDGAIECAEAFDSSPENVLSKGVRNVLVLAGLEIMKDSYLHRRWHSMDRTAHEQFLEKAAAEKAAAMNKRKTKKIP